MSGQPAGFTLDDKPVVTLDAGGYSFLHVAPGRYELKQFWPAGQSFNNPFLWNPDLSEDTKLPLNVTAGETRYFRMVAYILGSGPNRVDIRWRFTEVPDSIGRQEIVQEKFQPQDKNMPAEFRP